MSMDTVLVFVYGTLRRNRPSNHILVDPKTGSAIFLAAAQTVRRFPLVGIDRVFSFPMLDAPGRGLQVNGELWEISRRKLQELDILEIEVAGFVRRQIYVSITGGITPCWVYLYPHFDADRLENGEYPFHEEFTEDMAARYIPWDQRSPSAKEDYMVAVMLADCVPPKS